MAVVRIQSLGPRKNLEAAMASRFFYFSPTGPKAAFFYHFSTTVLKEEKVGADAIDIVFLFDFCFEGIEKGSTVAVSTYMASAHDNRQDQKEWFLPGYNEMLRRIEPERIICYNAPFPEMEGNIIPVDYERSGWKYMSFDKNGTEKELESFLIGGRNAQERDILEPYLIGLTKGGGNPEGGKWRPNPNKPEDARFLGMPGEIKTTTMRNGDVFRTKIGIDGRAVRERHETDHHRPDKHSNPHDHEIEWLGSDEHPNLGDPINYEGDVPEFKKLGGVSMGDFIYASSESMRFTSISDFKRSISWGCEAEFEWKGTVYGVIRYGTDKKITIYAANRPETEKVCETADDALEYMVGEDRLRDVITKVTVLSRSV